MSRFNTIFLSFTGGMLLLAGALYWLYERQHYEITDNAYLRANIILISPKVQGYVTRLLIDDNQSIQAGETLVEIDDQDYQAKVALARADMAAETAHITRLRRMKISQQDHIDSAEAALLAEEISLNLLNKELRRFKNLLKNGSATTQTLDKVQSHYQQATATKKRLQADLAAEKNRLATFDAEIAETRARLESAKAQWQLAKLDLEHTEIKAPLSGVIGHRGVQLGQWVHPGMALAYLVETQNIWVVANFKETQIETIKIGQPVDIHVDAYPDLKLSGIVDSFAPASGAEFSILPPENATGNFTKIVRRVPVKIVFASHADTHLLKPGLSVEVIVRVH